MMKKLLLSLKQYGMNIFLFVFLFLDYKSNISPSTKIFILQGETIYLIVFYLINTGDNVNRDYINTFLFLLLFLCILEASLENLNKFKVLLIYIYKIYLKSSDKCPQF